MLVIEGNIRFTHNTDGCDSLKTAEYHMNTLNKISLRLVVIAWLSSLQSKAEAAGYYNLGAFMQLPVVYQPEVGYLGSTYQSLTCPEGTYVTGIYLYYGWVVDGIKFNCSNSTTTAGKLAGGPNNIGNNSCTGTGNFVQSIELRAYAYMNCVSQIKLNCTNATSYTYGGSGAGGWGTWQAAQSCPTGYKIIGCYTNYAGSSFNSLGLICKWMP